MKKILILCLCCMLLTACGKKTLPDTTTAATSTTAAAVQETTTSPTEEIAEPTDTEAVPQYLIVFSPDDNLEGFLQTEVKIESLDENAIIDALIAAGVLTEDVAINTMALSGTELQLDLNSAFRDLILTQGTSGERAVMGSLVKTFLTAYPDAQTVSLTVEGEILESGHVAYDFPLEFYK